MQADTLHESAPAPTRWLRSASQSRYAALALAFVLTRAFFYALGLRFSLVLDWMFLADPADLRDRLLETVYYFHAFPPGMNLLTGVLLQISEANLAALAHAVFVACGLLLTGSLMYLARAVGAGKNLAFGIALAFSVIPQSLYFENLYLYDYPVPALLAFSAVLFHHAFRGTSFARWFWFFFVCAVLGWVRSALHLVWFLALLAFACKATRPGGRARVLRAALGPLALLLALYLKNLVVFGVFDSQSQSGGNFTLITTHLMPRALRTQWVKEGKLSPFADMSFASPPSAFLPYFESPSNPRYPHNEELERPSVKAPNYNHWFFLDVNEARRKDASYCLHQRPWQYVRTVLTITLPQAFSPSTWWHPRSGTARSPHAQHRQVLGGYEDLYNGAMHGFPARPYGVYALLPFWLGWVAVQGSRRLKKGDEAERLRAALLLLCAVQITYLIAITALLTFGENARYRYIVEPFIWVVALAATLDMAAWIRARWVRRSRGESEAAKEPAAAAHSWTGPV
jgi:hypothetical protein